MKEIGRVSMAVEVDGVVCFVALSQDKMKLLVQLAGSLSDSGSLPVKKAPPTYQFCTLEDA